MTHAWFSDYNSASGGGGGGGAGIPAGSGGTTSGVAGAQPTSQNSGGPGENASGDDSEGRRWSRTGGAVEDTGQSGGNATGGKSLAGANGGGAGGSQYLFGLIFIINRTRINYFF